MFERIPSGNESLMHIIDAMQESKTLRLTYQGFNHSHPVTFLAEPYCVKVFKQRWYMVAHSPEKDNIYIYALDRILQMEKTDVAFTFPDSFDAEAYFGNSYGIMVTPDELDVETIRIKVTDRNNKRKYLRLLPLHASQEETERRPDYSVFTYRLYPTYDFFQEVLSHGAEIEVLSQSGCCLSRYPVAMTPEKNNAGHSLFYTTREALVRSFPEYVLLNSADTFYFIDFL